MAKKLLVTLDINYNPAITRLTFPYMRRYSEKIEADFKVIDSRCFPGCSVNIEKFQLYELSRDYDWTIFIDADAIIHPNCPDMTEVYRKDTVIFNSFDHAPLRFRYNDCFRRDGRNLGATTWLTVFSDWTRDLWRPPEDDPMGYVGEIFPLHFETNFGYRPEHILDDYLVSLNIARYGLKAKTVEFDVFSKLNEKGKPLFFVHQYAVSEEEKHRLLANWDRLIRKESIADMMKRRAANR